jgi:hypothetical protein
MKKYLKCYILFVYYFTASCGQNSSEQKNIKSAEEAKPDSVKQKAPELKNKTQFDNLADFIQLSPITVLDPKSQNLYEKYGIEFKGYCYDCDLAAISINKKYFDIINVCDKNNFYRIENFSYEPYPNKLIVKTEKNEFIFTKIEAVPIYELKILGDKFLLKGKRISKFYTQEKELTKYKQHDCGEFGG